jgi:hypothetical protein
MKDLEKEKEEGRTTTTTTERSKNNFTESVPLYFQRDRNSNAANQAFFFFPLGNLI